MHQRNGEKTLEYLEQAYAEHSSYLSVIGVEPGMDFVRSDARFRKLQCNIGLLENRA